MHRLAAGRFQIELTLVELDDDGEPVNEYAQQPVIVFGLKAAQAWLDALPAQIAHVRHELDQRSMNHGSVNADAGP
jgi:hypothetical protein